MTKHRQSTRTSTTDMEVTSIRLERSLKDKLKELCGASQGYQSYIRDVLWTHVNSKDSSFKSDFSPKDIRYITPSMACTDLSCTMSGLFIPSGSQFYEGTIIDSGVTVPLSTKYCQDYLIKTE